MSKGYWKILLFVTGGLALWWVTTASIDLWSYFRLASAAPAEVQKWEIVPKKSKYTLRASYTYMFDEKKWDGSTVFGKPYHLNKQSAEAEIKRLEGFKWTAWVDPDHPDRSSIDKSFPWRKSFYAVCLLGIFLYFVFLRIHVEHLSNN